MKKADEVSILTAQLVSQLMYCSSRLREEDTDKILSEILKLTCTYKKKLKKIGAEAPP